uniref:ATPase AAA-type core domain-containing protein n=1 Tax=Ditylenchus dipsaci TaxID=166011 RepID=A0A915DDS3_9BILA
MMLASTTSEYCSESFTSDPIRAFECNRCVASSEERILFMTTNHKEKLDQALIRPGRWMFNRSSISTPEMLSMMFKRFYEDVTEEMCTAFKIELYR